MASSASPTRSGRPGGDLLVLMGFLLAVTAVAGIGGLASTSGVDGWYAYADKPWFTPPNWLFGPAWTFLYAAMAVAAWLVWRRRAAARSAGEAAVARTAGRALALWWLQLGVNFAWTPVFFALESLWPALGVILLLDALVAATLSSAWRVSRAAGLLLVPYLAWILYATALNAAIAYLN